MGRFEQTYGAGSLQCYWVRTDDPGFVFDIRMCPTKLPLIWEYRDRLYLVPFKVIKNARRIREDRQAHCDVYESGGKQAEPEIIMLSQAIPLDQMQAHYLTALTEQHPYKHEDDSYGHSP